MLWRKKCNSIPTICELGFKTLSNWLQLKQNGKTIQNFFDDNYISTIAIYGMGELGKRLYDELKELDVEVKYAIDKNADRIDIKGLEIITLEQELKAVDAIIVTPLHFFDEIEESIDKKGNFRVVSLEEVILYCL